MHCEKGELWEYNVVSQRDLIGSPRKASGVLQSYIFFWCIGLRSLFSSCRGASTCFPRFFPEDTAQCIFERFPLPFDVFEKGIVYHGLIAAATRAIDFRAKPIQDDLIEPYGYPGLAGMRLFYGSPLPFTEIVLFLHNVPP